MSLREKLIGAWELFSYVEVPVTGGNPIHRLGEKPKGLIIYTPDGYMSAQLMLPERTDFKSGDWFDATPDEYCHEATSYIAYSGKFFVNELEQTLQHSMYVSLFPNWTGQTQPRVVDIQGGVLKLSSASPIFSGGVEVMSYLEWHRAEPN
ncbi:lipocalin-like domain-containing protein [Enterobacter sp. UNJFSC 003]|uniref:lipocalin-like domain-containing protein n=1 Tax=Enterobacter sp. UNJFSC 003 TaxID=3122077 RepID=UPI002EA8650F|nr:lipocalin-like domain-containing protein [Serratia liquefaciens]